MTVFDLEKDLWKAIEAMITRVVAEERRNLPQLNTKSIQRERRKALEEIVMLLETLSEMELSWRDLSETAQAHWTDLLTQSLPMLSEEVV